MGPLDHTKISGELWRRAGAGDRAALDELLERHVAPLRTWASGRLPSWARSAADTEDLVQDSILHLIERGAEFRPRHDGAVLAYLRTTLKNRIRDRVRDVMRRGQKRPLPSEVADSGPSALDSAIACETLGRYDQAFDRLAPAERDLIVARVELGLSWREVARLTSRPTPEAARAAATRAVRKLAKEMSIEHPDRSS